MHFVGGFLAGGRLMKEDNELLKGELLKENCQRGIAEEGLIELVGRL
jgi:hypothetical protein